VAHSQHKVRIQCFQRLHRRQAAAVVIILTFHPTQAVQAAAVQAETVSKRVRQALQIKVMRAVRVMTAHRLMQHVSAVVVVVLAQSVATQFRLSVVEMVAMVFQHQSLVHQSHTVAAVVVQIKQARQADLVLVAQAAVAAVATVQLQALQAQQIAAAVVVVLVTAAAQQAVQVDRVL
jgi:hypothetical protein